MDAAVDYLKSGKKAEGVSEIYVPGEPEALAYSHAEKEGLEYPVEIIEENRELGKKYNVPFTL